MKTASAAGFCLLCLATASSNAENVILVEDSELLNPAIQNWLPEELELAPVSDGGELLRDLPGIAGRRMGGRGIDPIIRGQSNNRLNILLDGAYVFGGYDGAKHFTVMAGINNVFDRNYACHVNAANMDPFNPTAVQVNEPGREYWVRVNATI